MTYSRFSRQETTDIFELLAKNFPRGQWLIRNRYRDNCIKKINTDCPSGRPRAIKKRSLKKYIAASAPLHCMDGWSLLGKALLSCSLGDSISAKHFAYYAELRAIMSLLASEGIGIFDGKNFTMDNMNLHGPILGRTHGAARDAFEDWAQSSSAGDLLGKIIRPGGIELREWFEEISSTAGSGPISYVAKDWLEAWGYDITTLSSDRKIRNEASYRPSGLKSLLSMNARFISNFITDMWTLFTPDDNQSYYLDRLLLKKATDKYLDAIGPSRARALHSTIPSLVSKLSFSPQKAVAFVELLSGNFEQVDGHQLLSLANSKVEDRNQYLFHFSMLSRAALLLRLATGACARLAAEAGVGKEDLRFWWMPLGVRFGLWEETELDPLFVMWKDVEQALSNVKDKVTGTMQMARWRTQYSGEIVTLSGCERIGLAGICV